MVPRCRVVRGSVSILSGAEDQPAETGPQGSLLLGTYPREMTLVDGGGNAMDPSVDEGKIRRDDSDIGNTVSTAIVGEGDHDGGHGDDPESALLAYDAGSPLRRPAATSRIRTNLPTMYGELVGREVDIQRVLDALSSPSWPLVCLKGFGGIGKTSLANQIAQRYVNGTVETATQLEAVVWISTRGRPTQTKWLNEVLDTVARVHGYQNIEQIPHDQKREVVKQLIASHPTMIVVDNYETIEDPELNAWMDTIPVHSKGLITARPSHVIESLHNVWHIDLFGLDPASSLLLIRRHADRLGLKAIRVAPDDILKPLVEISKGSPFIIELSLGYIKQGRLSFQQVVQHLGEANTTMDNVFDYLFARAWDLMSSNTRCLLMVGPFFAGPTTMEELAAASGLTKRHFDVALEQLVELGLLDISEELDISGMRYSMHPITRAFAQSKIRQRAPFQKTARERWSRYYLELVKRNVFRNVSKDYYWNVLSRQTYPELDKAWLNIRSVLEWADNTAQPEILLDLVQLLVHYMNRRMLYSARTYYGERAARAAQQLGYKEIQAWLRVDALGWVYIEEGRTEEAIAQIHTGINLAQELGLESTVGKDVFALAKAFLARALLESGHVSDAKQEIEQASAISCQPIIKCRVDMLAGDIAVRETQIERAISLYQAAIAVAEAEQDSDVEALVRYRLGDTYLTKRDLEGAERQFKLIADAEHEETNVMAAYALFGLAGVAKQRGDLQRARQLAFEVQDQLSRFIGKHHLLPQLQVFLTEVTNTDDAPHEDEATKPEVRNHRLAPLLTTFPHTQLVQVIHEYTSGRSGAPVLLAHFRSSGLQGIEGTRVVKVGPPDWASREKSFYNGDQGTLAPFIAQYLASSRAVEGLVAVAYDVAFNKILGTRSLATLVEIGGTQEHEAQGQLERLTNALVRWNVSDVWNNHRLAEPYMLLYYLLSRSKVWDSEDSQDQVVAIRERYSHKLSTYLTSWNAETPRVSIDGSVRTYVLPNPLAFLYNERWMSSDMARMSWAYPVGRIHGDLHSGNVICLPGSNDGPKVIDFALARPDGIPFFDLAILEFDILLHVMAQPATDARDQRLALLESIMSEVTVARQPTGYYAAAGWRLVSILRADVMRLITAGGTDREGFEITWWLAAMAAGLNYARKGRAGDLQTHQRATALLYAAFALQRLDTMLDLGLSGTNVTVLKWKDFA